MQRLSPIQVRGLVAGCGSGRAGVPRCEYNLTSDRAEDLQAEKHYLGRFSLRACHPLKLRLEITNKPSHFSFSDYRMRHPMRQGSWLDVCHLTDREGNCPRYPYSFKTELQFVCSALPDDVHVDIVLHSRVAKQTESRSYA